MERRERIREQVLESTGMYGPWTSFQPIGDWTSIKPQKVEQGCEEFIITCWCEIHKTRPIEEIKKGGHI